MNRNEDAEARLAGRTGALDDAPIPGSVGVIGIRDRRANGRQNVRGMRAFDRQAGKRFARVLERHVVGDDVFVQVAVDQFASFGLGIQQETVIEAEQVDVGQYVALRIQEKGVASHAGLKLLHVVGGHGMQQAGAIRSGRVNAPARRKIQPGSGRT